MKDTLISFIEKAKKTHKDKFDYSKSVYVNSKTKIKVICQNHGEFYVTPSNHIFGVGCKKCIIDNNRKKSSLFIEEANLVHNFKYNYNNIEYINNNTKIKILCFSHGLFEQTPKNHLKNHGCSKCAIESTSEQLRLTQKEFIEKSNIKHKNLYNYNKSIYVNNYEKVIITCLQHGDFKIRPHQHFNGIGCSKCSGNHQYSTEEFIKKCKKVHNNKYDYTKTNYINGKSKIIIICSKHGEFQQTASHHLSGVACSGCNESKGEKKIREFLNENNIKFIAQKKFNDCVNPINGCKLKFDFFLPENNTCIEFDGMQHFKPIKYFGGLSHFKQVIKFDSIKNGFCDKQNIKLIRIKYNDKIIEKLKKELEFYSFS